MYSETCCTRSYTRRVGIISGGCYFGRAILDAFTLDCNANEDNYIQCLVNCTSSLVTRIKDLLKIAVFIREVYESYYTCTGVQQRIREDEVRLPS